METNKPMTEKEYIDYFENNPKVVELKKKAMIEYSKGNYVKAASLNSQIEKIRNSVYDSLKEERVRLSDLKAEMSEEDTQEVMFKVNKLIFLADMIDEAVFSIKEIMKKYHTDFFAFDEFAEAAKRGKKHINILMMSNNNIVKDVFVDFTDQLNTMVNAMIANHIFKKDSEDKKEE